MTVRSNLVVFVALAAVVGDARGEITAVRGTATAELQEFRSDRPGDRDEATDELPVTQTTFPVRVATRLDSGGGAFGAAGAAGQLADPRDLDQDNPAEFAANLALSSVNFGTRYETRVKIEESREIVFHSDELGGLAAGESATVSGTFFLDGALTLYSTVPDRDFTGASIIVNLVLTKRVAGGETTNVFDGRVEFAGVDRGGAVTSIAGGMPAGALVQASLPAIASDFPAVQVAVLPNMKLNYEYQAVVGEAFTLAATLTIEARNVGGFCGVAAVIGSPIESLQRVIEITQGTTAASKLIAAIESQRRDSTGAAIGADVRSHLPPVGACGVFGLEFVIGFAAVCGFRARGVARPILRSAGAGVRPCSSCD